MTTARVELPIPPSVNAMFLNRRAGRPGRGRVKSSTYQHWIIEAGWEAKLASLPKFGGAYALTLSLPQGMRGDVDNRLKPVLDLFVDLQITADDKHCSEARVRRADVPKGRCIVEITGDLR